MFIRKKVCFYGIVGCVVVGVVVVIYFGWCIDSIWWCVIVMELSVRLGGVVVVVLVWLCIISSYIGVVWLLFFFKFM